MCRRPLDLSIQIFQQPPKTHTSKAKIKNSLYRLNKLSLFLYFQFTHITFPLVTQDKKLSIKLTSTFYLACYVKLTPESYFTDI